MAPPLSRRDFLLASGAAALLPACRVPGAVDKDTAVAARFAYSVASGDPVQDAVILWTHVTPSADEAAVELEWRIAGDEAFAKIVRQGRARARREDDYTCKIDVSGLDPDTVYWYAFSAGAEQSPVGRTRTLPEGSPESVKLAVTTCGAYDSGYFNTYMAIAQSEVQAVLHLGDYIYEGIGSDDNPLGRTHQPRKRTVTVEEYRTRYRQYRSDPDLQALHAAHPLIHIWDDHELANNCFTDGAEGHKPEDGDWTARKAAATQVFHEWLPIRTHASGDRERIWREFRFGDLAQLAMLETRITGKSPPAIGAGVDDPARTLIGDAQREWLQQQLQTPALWKLLGQQTQMAPMNYLALPELIGSQLGATVVIGANGIPINYDSWDGYAAERRRLYGFIEAQGVQNVVVLTGDNHYAFAADLIPDTANPLNAPVAVEFGTTSASSPTAGAGSNDDLLRRLNPWIRYFEAERNGWIELELTRERCAARYMSVETRSQRSSASTLTAERTVLAGTNRLEGGVLPL